jgi:ComF family protein
MPADPPIFVWPPKRPPHPSQRAMPTPDPGAATIAQSFPDQVVSRPQPPGASPPSFALHAPASRSVPSVSPVWPSIEETWLDVTAPPLHRRLAELGWRPDSPDAYCPVCGQSRAQPGRPCPDCPEKPAWQRLVRLGPYYSPLTRLIHEVKFTRWRRLGRDLGTLLGQSVATEIDRIHPQPKRIVVVPVPTSFLRRLTRGIDHPAVLSRAVAHEAGAGFLPLLRRSHRPSQTSLPASRRGANVANTIHPRRAADLQDALVIVVDDVTTTGATLRAACRAVAQAAKRAGSRPAAIWTAVVAVTPK